MFMEVPDVPGKEELEFEMEEKRPEDWSIIRSVQNQEIKKNVKPKRRSLF